METIVREEAVVSMKKIAAVSTMMTDITVKEVKQKERIMLKRRVQVNKELKMEVEVILNKRATMAIGQDWMRKQVTKKKRDQGRV